MRTINTFMKKPDAREVVRVGTGKRAWAYVRTDIHEHTVTDEEGEKHKEWTAVEYATQINALTDGFEISDELADQIIAAETDKEAKNVRAKRNILLEQTDKEMLTDRAAPESERYQAYAAYRQALRDIPTQTGFPFDVEWPEKPTI